MRGPELGRRLQFRPHLLSQTTEHEGRAWGACTEPHPPPSDPGPRPPAPPSDQESSPQPPSLRPRLLLPTFMRKVFSTCT